MHNSGKRSLRGLGTENVNDFRFHRRIKKENKVNSRRTLRRKLNRNLDK